MNQAPGRVALLCVDEHAAGGETSLAHPYRSIAVLNRSDVIGMQSQHIRYRRQQLAVGTVEQNGLLRVHRS